MTSGEPQHHCPQQPAGPEKPGERQQDDNGPGRNPTMRARIDGKDDVTAIELPAGNQVQGRGKHSYPGSQSRGMENHLTGAELGDGCVAACGDKEMMGQLKDQGNAKQRGLLGFRGYWLAGEQGKKHYRNRHDESRDRSGNADIKKIFAVANGRADADKGTHGANEAGKGDEKRPGRINLTPHAEDVMSHFMGGQDAKQAGRKWNAKQQPMPV